MHLFIFVCVKYIVSTSDILSGYVAELSIQPFQVLVDWLVGWKFEIMFLRGEDFKGKEVEVSKLRKILIVYYSALIFLSGEWLVYQATTLLGGLRSSNRFSCKWCCEELC